MRIAYGAWAGILGAAVICLGTAVAQSERQSRRDAAPIASEGRVPEAGSPRAVAPVDLTGHWVSVVTEDWAWRMRTPPKGDYASVPLNANGVRVADTWDESQDGSCLAFGAAAVLRMPTRVRIDWEDDWTLRLDTDNGMQTRVLRFIADGGAADGSVVRGAAAASPAPGAAAEPGAPKPAFPAARSLQGDSWAEWQIVGLVTGSGADSGVVSTRLAEGRWAPLKVVTTNLQAAWLRPNGVPVSEQAVVTEYFDAFPEGPDAWFTVTTIVDDPVYLSERFIVSSNFRREPDGTRWSPAPCRD